MTQRKGLQFPGSTFCCDSEKGARSLEFSNHTLNTTISEVRSKGQGVHFKVDPVCRSLKCIHPICEK